MSIPKRDFGTELCEIFKLPPEVKRIVIDLKVDSMEVQCWSIPSPDMMNQLVDVLTKYKIEMKEVKE